MADEMEWGIHKMKAKFYFFEDIGYCMRSRINIVLDGESFELCIDTEKKQYEISKHNGNLEKLKEFIKTKLIIMFTTEISKILHKL